jgi:hypothetical protein
MHLFPDFREVSPGYLFAIENLRMHDNPSAGHIKNI